MSFELVSTLVEVCKFDVSFPVMIVVVPVCCAVVVVPVCCVVVVVPFCCVVVVCSFALSFSVVSGDVADVIPGRMPVDVSVIMSDVMSVGVVMVEELTDSAFNTSKVQIQSNLV
jgi:hypothetical protein